MALSDWVGSLAYLLSQGGRLPSVQGQLRTTSGLAQRFGREYIDDVVTRLYVARAQVLLYASLYIARFTDKLNFMGEIVHIVHAGQAGRCRAETREGIISM